MEEDEEHAVGPGNHLDPITLDYRVAVEFFGFQKGQDPGLVMVDGQQRAPPAFSSCIVEGWKVLQELVERLPDGDIHLEHRHDEWGVSTCSDESGWRGWVRADDPLHAICGAAILASSTLEHLA